MGIYCFLRLNAGFVLAICALTLGLWPLPAAAQNLRPIVIEGGTLIDGNGGPPVPNAVIVIEGNMISAAGAAGMLMSRRVLKLSMQPANGCCPACGMRRAIILRCGENYFPISESRLNIDVGLGGEVSIASRDAVNRGLQIGPREFIGIAHFGRYNESNISGYETLYDGWQYPRSLEELQAASHRLLDAGADMLMFHDGSWPFEWVQWGCNEVHIRGKPCFQRSDGPNTGIVEAARAGGGCCPSCPWGRSPCRARRCRGA